MWQINRAQLALILHVPPAVIDAMPVQDALLLLAVHEANQKLMQRGR